VVLILLVAQIGCGVVPRDSAGTLERVRGGELRVGVAPYDPWVRLDGERVGGLEPELLEAWARQLGAGVTWRRGPEAELIQALHHRELDVVAAGLASDTPYAAQIAVSRPYLVTEDRYGSTKKHVLAVMPGESALLLSLDRFLASPEAVRLLAERRARAGAHQP
jgi:hypothetical protein